MTEITEITEMPPELLRIQFCDRCNTLTKHETHGGNWYCSVCKQLWH